MKKVVLAVLCGTMAVALCGCIVVKAPEGIDAPTSGNDPAAGTSASNPPAYSPGNPGVSNSGITNPTPTPADPAGSGVPSEDALLAWSALQGYWNADDGLFFVLDRADAHSVVFRYAKWETEYDSDYCVVKGLKLDGPKALVATVVSGGDEIALRVDWSGMEQDGKIIVVFGEGYYQCAYAGSMQDEAYAVHLENMGY